MLRSSRKCGVHDFVFVSEKSTVSNFYFIDWLYGFFPSHRASWSLPSAPVSLRWPVGDGPRPTCCSLRPSTGVPSAAFFSFALPGRRDREFWKMLAMFGKSQQIWKHLQNLLILEGSLSAVSCAPLRNKFIIFISTHFIRSVCGSYGSVCSCR